MYLLNVCMCIQNNTFVKQSRYAQLRLALMSYNVCTRSITVVHYLASFTIFPFHIK